MDIFKHQQRHLPANLNHGLYSSAVYVQLELEESADSNQVRPLHTMSLIQSIRDSAMKEQNEKLCKNHWVMCAGCTCNSVCVRAHAKIMCQKDVCVCVCVCACCSRCWQLSITRKWPALCVVQNQNVHQKSFSAGTLTDWLCIMHMTLRYLLP